MIARVHPHGVNLPGLLKYLYGPGKHEEHVNPRLVAAWNDAGPTALLEPTPTGRSGWDVRTLADALRAPVTFNDRAPDRPVWHCSVRLAPHDRTLSDADWAHIAGELMARAGLAPHGDAGGVRWVAVRHGDDHIHLVATLARQDGRPIRMFKEWKRLRAACRDLERQYGLRSTAPDDRTAHSHPGAAELNKARRQRRARTPRDELRDRVRRGAAAAGSSIEFFDLLDADGLLVKLRHSTRQPGQITGYAVALPEALAADGTPIFFGGGRLSPELSLPRLRQRWNEHDSTASSRSRTRGAPGRRVDPAIRAWALEQASVLIREAVTALRTDPTGQRWPAVAAAAAEYLTVLADVVAGAERARMFRAANALRRAAADPPRHQQARVARVEGLRGMGRLLALMGRLSDNPDLFAALRLILDLSLLADTLAQLRDTQRRAHQARAARAAGQELRRVLADRGYVPPAPLVAGLAALPPTPPPPGTPTSPREAAGHTPNRRPGPRP